jgi:hypothetical protein
MGGAAVDVLRYLINSSDQSLSLIREHSQHTISVESVAYTTDCIGKYDKAKRHCQEQTAMVITLEELQRKPIPGMLGGRGVYIEAPRLWALGLSCDQVALQHPIAAARADEAGPALNAPCLGLP